MSKALRPTLVDYVIAAINPALIVVLLASLLFFLLEVFYQGEYSTRLYWVLGLFVLGVVCVTRIAIEQDPGRAVAFGAALAVVTFLALEAFLNIGAAHGPISTLINLGLILIVWWVAHRLTWECSGFPDLDQPVHAPLWEVVQGQWLQRRSPPKTDEAALGESRQWAKATSAEEPEGLTSPELEEPEQKPRPKKQATGRKPLHPPGVGVLYLSLIALPLFGLGELLAGPARWENRGRLVMLLSLYLGSGFGLLLSTSFLNLRRYLRSRKLPMPEEMTATWLAAGAVIILAALAVAWLIPRPLPPQLNFTLAGWITSPETKSSPVAPPGEPASDPSPKHPGAAISPENGGESSPNVATPESHRPEGPQEDSTEGQTSHTGGEAKATQPASSPDARSETEGGKADSQQTSSTQRKPTRSGDGPEGRHHQPAEQRTERNGEDSSTQDVNTSQDPESRQSAHHEQGADSEAGAKSPTGRRSAGPGQPARQEGVAGSSTQRGTSKQDQMQEAAASAARSASPPTPPRPLGWSLPQAVSSWLRWLVIVVAVAAMAYALWRNRAAVRELLTQLQALLREFWQSLFGREGPPETPAPPQLSPTKKVRFVDFPNPFRTRLRRRLSHEGLVVYTFRALEAWAAEFASPRQEFETPLEFTWRLAPELPEAELPLRRLGEMYACVAYGPGKAGTVSVDEIRLLWEVLEHRARHTPPPPPVVAAP